MVDQINGEYGGRYVSTGTGGGTSDEPVKKKSETSNVHDDYKKYREEREKEYNNYRNSVDKEYQEYRAKILKEFDEYKAASMDDFEARTLSKMQVMEKELEIQKQIVEEVLKNQRSGVDNSTVQVRQALQIEEHKTGLPIEEVPHLEKDENGNLVSNYYDSNGNLVKSVPYKTESAVKAQKGEKAVETGLPIEEVPHLEKDENGNSVVNYYDGDGNLVKSTPYKSSVADVKEVPKTSEEVPNTNPQPAQNKVQPRTIETEGVKGTYILTEGENGKGFSLKQNMSVSLINSEVKQFFLPNNREITQSEDGTYEYRGIKSKNFSALQNRIMLTAQRTAMNNAVYQDLLQRQKSGVELTDAEKSFMNQYKGSLASYGLGVDDNGKLFDLKE